MYACTHVPYFTQSCFVCLFCIYDTICKQPITNILSEEKISILIKQCHKPFPTNTCPLSIILLCSTTAVFRDKEFPQHDVLLCRQPY